VSLPDTAPPDAPFDSLEAASEAAPDLVLDAPVEGGPDDGSPDLAPVDLAVPDAPVGAPSITGKLSRTVAPLLDAKGTIYVGVYNPLIPAFPMASVALKGSHLVTTGTTISYSMYNIGPGPYSLSAFLDDNVNAVLPFLLPDNLDLVMSTAKQVKVVAGQTLNIDLVLDSVAGASDGGMGNSGVLKGMVKASVSPSLDGKGTLFVSLHKQLPPQGQVAAAPQNGADLSSPFAQEAYYIGATLPGQYYLRVFLDDNSNANPFGPNPDKGDLVHSQPIQVHVVAGMTTVHNVVLDKVQP